jgi:ribose transport system ATP-binding protein
LRDEDDGKEPTRDDALKLPPTSKSFAGNLVLDSVGLRVAPGEVRGLVGLNGSGKSTLVKLLAGVHKPDTPISATAGGQTFELGDHAGAHMVGVRFVHQDLALIDSLSSVDNVGIGSTYIRRSFKLIHWRNMRRRTTEILAELGYNFDVNIPVESLTPSQRTGVAIARALYDWNTGSKLVVLDEPTASMPAAEVQNLFQAIDRMRAEGVAVILVSHHLNEIISVADTVSVLRNGRLVATEPTPRMTEARLAELMLGKQLMLESRTRTGRFDTAPLLSVEGLRTSLIESVNLELRAGEIVGIAGLTGSGREELLPAIFGMIPRQGGVRALSKVLQPGRPPKAVGAGIGYVPAHRLRDGVFPAFDMTVNFTISNLSPATQRGLVSRSAERNAMSEWIEELEVRPADPAAAIVTLSGGNQQKVVVGRWARRQGGVSVLLLDEPTQGVDVSARESIYQALSTFSLRGGVLLSSSDTEELCQVCHRVLVMHRGRIVVELSGHDLTTEAVDAYSLGAAQSVA